MSLLIAGLVFATGSGTAVAQDDNFKVVPVELWACTYNDGKDAGDLDDVIEKWSEWADDRGVDDYAVWTLTPYYFGPGENSGIDVIWMGAGTDAVALGARQDEWLAGNDGLADEFFDVITCGAHGNYASINVKLPPEDETPTNAVLTFSDCKIKKGASGTMLSAALAEWSEYMTESGSPTGIWQWYAAYGGGGETFDFKWLEAHENLEALGRDYEAFGNGYGFVKYGQLFEHLIDCDSARAYLAQNRRFVQLR